MKVKKYKIWPRFSAPDDSKAKTWIYGSGRSRLFVFISSQIWSFCIGKDRYWLLYSCESDFSVEYLGVHVVNF